VTCGTSSSRNGPRRWPTTRRPPPRRSTGYCITQTSCKPVAEATAYRTEGRRDKRPRDHQRKQPLRLGLEWSDSNRRRQLKAITEALMPFVVVSARRLFVNHVKVQAT
jgi:hypothetical protein